MNRRNLSIAVDGGLSPPACHITVVVSEEIAEGGSKFVVYELDMRLNTLSATLSRMVRRCDTASSKPSAKF